MPSVVSVLETAKNKWPEKIALIDYGSQGSEPVEITYEELFIRAMKFAAHLKAFNPGRGQNIALIAGNSLNFVVAWFGILAGGNRIVPIPADRKSLELGFRIKNSECSVLIYDTALEEVASGGIERSGRSVKGFRLEEIAGVSAERSDFDQQFYDFEGRHTAMIIYTSGTTASPKGVTISHGSILQHGAAVSKQLTLESDDRVLGVLPLALSYGCRVTMLATFRAGGTLVLLPKFDAERVVELLKEEEISFLPGAPTHFQILSNSSGETFPDLRLCLSAGAPLRAGPSKEAEERLGARLIQGYGLTEAHFCVLDSPDNRQAGSVGFPFGDVSIQIVDDDGNPLEAGVSGEILVRGCNLLTEYIGLESPLNSQGYLPTGDIGMLEADGRLVVIDRKKDMIVVGGNNISPTAVEIVFTENEDVLQAAVIGIEDEKYDEVPAVLLVVKESSELNVPAFLDAMHDDQEWFKVPRAFAVVDELPLTSTGKLSKAAIREMIQDGDIELTRTPSRRNHN